MPPARSNGASRRKQTSCQDVRVIDGDTIVVDGEHVRLEGIDAPELEQTCKHRNQDVTYGCGRAASAALRGLVGANHPVTCTPTSKDRYGRTLAYCKAGEVDLNREMVLTGWALAFVKYNSEYLPEEAIARKRNVGLGDGDFDYPWDWRHSH